MPISDKSRVAVVDLGMGNLFSVRQACLNTGMDAVITSSSGEISSAAAVILPGVGAFGSAIETLRRLNLMEVLREAISSKPFMGICLGMQLLMRESFEFGHHRGLGVIDGSVVKFEVPSRGSVLKVPQIGWNRIYSGINSWNDTALDGLRPGEFMYFVHSYYVKLDDDAIGLSTTKYGNVEFCSSLQHKNVFACQFHPERSGPNGVRIYENFAHNIS